MVTGPPPDGQTYGSLYGHYVIHAVGPDYRQAGNTEASMQRCDRLLASAYAESVALARERNVEAVGFPLLSAGVFKGRRPLEAVLRVAVDAVLNELENSPSSIIREVHLIAFSAEEQLVLKRCLAQVIAEREAGALRSGWLMKMGKQS